MQSASVVEKTLEIPNILVQAGIDPACHEAYLKLARTDVDFNLHLRANLHVLNNKRLLNELMFQKIVKKGRNPEHVHRALYQLVTKAWYEQHAHPFFTEENIELILNARNLYELGSALKNLHEKKKEGLIPEYLKYLAAHQNPSCLAKGLDILKDKNKYTDQNIAYLCSSQYPDSVALGLCELGADVKLTPYILRALDKKLLCGKPWLSLNSG